jgi:hypothetical protein
MRRQPLRRRRQKVYVFHSASSTDIIFQDGFDG